MIERLARATLYDQDFFEWTQETARLVREGRFAEVDLEAVAEEIESLGRSDRRQLGNRLQVLIMHLLKWQMQPQRRSGSWAATIVEQRLRLEYLLRDSPSLRLCVPSFAGDVYPHAVEKAVYQMRLIKNPFPLQCPYTASEILDRSFYPSVEGEKPW